MQHLMIGRKTIAFALLYTFLAVAEDSKESKFYDDGFDGIAFPKTRSVEPPAHDKRKEMISLELARKIDSSKSFEEILRIMNYGVSPAFAPDNDDEETSIDHYDFGYPGYFAEDDDEETSIDHYDFGYPGYVAEDDDEETSIDHHDLGYPGYVAEGPEEQRAWGEIPHRRPSNIHQNGRMGQRSNAERPKPATCIPELQVVPFQNESDISTFILPTCTRIMRCGGCCTHSLFSCQPNAAITRNFEVLVIKISDVQTIIQEKQIIPLEEHTECKCACKIKEKDCNERQEYFPKDCECRCKNIDEETKCLRNNDTKVWKANQCACVCREVLECSTGFFFDQNTCRCEPESVIY